MRLILVRHGETYGNLEEVSQGQKDYKLTDKGIKQAEKISLKLKDVEIDVVYSSDLSRCVDTAKEILKYHSEVKLILSKGLREQAKGIWEGKSHDLLNEFFNKKNIEYYDFEPESGEKYVDLFKRVAEFFDSIKDKHENDTVLIVGHGSQTACLLAYLLKKPIEDTDVLVPTKNTAISIIEIKNGKAKIECLNCIKHLK